MTKLPLTEISIGLKKFPDGLSTLLKKASNVCCPAVKPFIFSSICAPRFAVVPFTVSPSEINLA